MNKNNINLTFLSTTNINIHKYMWYEKLNHNHNHNLKNVYIKKLCKYHINTFICIILVQHVGNTHMYIQIH